MNTSDVGKVDALFEILKYVNKDTPKEVNRYVDGIAEEDKGRPIADVLLDKVLASQPKNKAQEISLLISRILSRSPFGASTTGDEGDKSIGFFLNQWIKLETTIRKLGPSKTTRFAPITYALRIADLPTQTRETIEKLSQLRNALVHGVARPTEATLFDAGTLIRDSILPELLRKITLRRRKKTHGERATRYS
jgi:hypothetical protein